MRRTDVCLIKQNTELQIDKFQFFKVSEIFVEKQKFQRLYMEEKTL